MCSGGGDKKAPDMSGLQSSMDANNAKAWDAVNKDQTMRNQVYADSKPGQQRLEAMASRIANQQLGVADEAHGFAREQLGDYRSTYRPIEQQQAMMSQGGLDMSQADVGALASRLGIDPAQAQQMLSLSRGAMENRARQAVTQSNASANSAYGQGLRQLTRMGGDPRRLAQAAAGMAGQQTLASANAANQARTGARNELMQNTAATANYGRNMPNTALQYYGLGTNAGNSGLAAQNAGYMSALPYAQYASGGVGNALGAAGLGNQSALGMGGLMNQQYNTDVGRQNAQDASNAAAWQGLGQAAGMVAGMPSGGKDSITYGAKALNWMGL